MPELFHPQGFFKFPKRKFGSTKRSLSRATWCEDHPWLHYDKASDWVAQLIIVMAAANAASERSFSVLCRIRAI